MSRRRKNGARRAASKQRICEPSLCDHCQYIGDGDFICDEHSVIVIESWDPTENYLCCRSADKRGG